MDGLRAEGSPHVALDLTSVGSTRLKEVCSARLRGLGAADAPDFGELFAVQHGHAVPEPGRQDAKFYLKARVGVRCRGDGVEARRRRALPPRPPFPRRPSKKN